MRERACWLTNLYPTSAVASLAGHPEFTSGIMQRVIDARLAAGVFTPEFAEQSRHAAEQRHDGVRIARVLLTVLGGF